MIFGLRSGTGLLVVLIGVAALPRPVNIPPLVAEAINFKTFFRFMFFLLDRSSIGRRRLVHLTSISGDDRFL